MSGIELGRTLHTVVFTDCQAGLGIKVIGGIAEEDEDDRDFGIFIKKVLPGGVAALDGRLQEGDQLIEVNGQNLEGVTNEEAVQCLRLASASDYIQLVICRDLQGRDEYMELLNNYSYSSASSVYEQSSLQDIHFHGSKDTLGVPEGRAQSSRSITPTNHIRTPKSPMHTPRLADKVPGESSSASDMELNSPRLRPNSSPPYPSHHTHPDLPFYGTQSLPRVPKVPNASAALMNGLLVPSLASTPQQYMGSVPNIKSSPDGVSGATLVQSRMMHEPSPVINSSDPNNFRPGLLLSDMSYGMVPLSQQEEDFSHTGLSRKLSLDSTVRLPVAKLEVALRYLGIEATPQQRSQLQRKIRIDSDGTVSYGEFVRAAREVFRFELQQRKVTPAAFYLASPDISNTYGQPAQAAVGQHSAVHNKDTLQLEQELLRVQGEKEKLSLEVERLKVLLQEKEESSFMTDDEMHRLKKESKSALQENRALKTKVHLAEQAQRAARNMEQDYAEVIRLLEKELSQLKTHTQLPQEKPSVHKRLAVLGCQLRKAEVSKKTFEVSTDKLLHLAELVVQNLSGRGASQQASPGNQLSPAQVASKAKDTILAVRSLLETEPLPFGWEEAYTADGAKYFINHVTQNTMWHHPVSKVEQTVSPSMHKPQPYTNNPHISVSHSAATAMSSSSGTNSPQLHQHKHSPPTPKQSSPTQKTQSGLHHQTDDHKSHTLPKASRQSKEKLSPRAKIPTVASTSALSGPVAQPVRNGKVVKLLPRESRGNLSTGTKKKVAETAT